MQIEIAYTQHSGKLHRSQQDAIWTGCRSYQEADLTVGHALINADNIFIAVADGVSVSPSPELASRFVIDALGNDYQQSQTASPRMIRRAHGQLCDKYAKGRTFGASTTVACAQITETGCLVLNVGDSRGYLLRHNGDWMQLSRDHTILERMIAEGEADADEKYSQIYNALEHCLIADDEETEFPVHSKEVKFLQGDTLLLCTDGVHDTLGAQRLQSLFAPIMPTRNQAAILRNEVLRLGAPDNFSLILARRLAG